MTPTPHVVRISYPQGGPVFEFDHTVSQQQASRALFGADGPPPGVTVHEGHTTGEWQVAGLNTGNVGRLTGNLPAIVASSTEVVPRAEYDVERHARESADDAAMNQPLPGVGKTAQQLFDEYGPGHHEVNGNFVWIGTKDGAQTIQWHPRADNEVFNTDIRWYLDHGLSLSDSIHRFNQQWNQIAADILRAFGGTLASAGGAGVPTKPPFTVTQAATLGVDALRTLRVPHGLSEEIPMPADGGATKPHNDKGPSAAGGDAEAQPSQSADPEEASQESRSEGDGEQEYGECTPDGDEEAVQDPGDYLGVSLGLGPGVSLDDLTPASFTSGPQVDVAPGVLRHDDASNPAVLNGAFDDGGTGVCPLGADDDGDPGSPGADGDALPDPGWLDPGAGPDEGAFRDPGIVGDETPSSPGGASDGAIFADPSVGFDGGILIPGRASDGSAIGDRGTGFDGGPLISHDASNAGALGDPGAGYDGASLAGGHSDDGVFADPGAGYDAGICSAASGPDPGQNAANFGPGTQPGIDPNQGAGAFGGDPGAFGAAPGPGLGGDVAGASGDGAGSGGM